MWFREAAARLLFQAREVPGNTTENQTAIVKVLMVDIEKLCAKHPIPTRGLNPEVCDIAFLVDRLR